MAQDALKKVSLGNLVPYAGVAIFRDGRYIVASRKQGRLALMSNDDLMITSTDFHWGRYFHSPKYEKVVCYGIALHVSERTLYGLMGLEDENELYITRIEISDEPPYFIWHPYWDIRLPSVAARNKDYNTFYSIEWGKVTASEDANVEQALSDEILNYDANSIQWLTHLLRYQNDGRVVCRWDNLEDELAINLTDFPTLGPILPEYHPSITSVGAKVMVSCTHAQLYQASFDMKLWIDESMTWDEARTWWINTLRELIREADLPLDEEPHEDDKLIHGPLWSDYFPEGRKKSWWIEPYAVYEDGQPTGYNGSWLHVKVAFYYPFPCSSVVTLYPDLGSVEGISHIGSALVCAVPNQGLLNNPWYSEWPNPIVLNHQHLKKNAYYPVGIVAEEADITMFLAPQNYVIPANVLTWPEIAPWEDPQSESTTVADAFKTFFRWWWINVYLNPESAQNTDVVTRLRSLQQADPIKNHIQRMAYIREDKVWTTRRDSSRNAVNVSSKYIPEMPCYPWSIIEDVNATCIEICSERTMVVTDEKVLRGTHALYRLTSMHNEHVLGVGTDIHVGKVIKDKAKVIQVRFDHSTRSHIKLKNIRIRIVPDTDFPYYRFAKLSLDGTTWQDSILYDGWVVHEDYAAKLELPTSFTFYVQLLCDSTNDDPKPIPVNITYTRGGS